MGKKLIDIFIGAALFLSKPMLTEKLSFKGYVIGLRFYFLIRELNYQSTF
ncbi:hypothetical protein BTN50_0551 [Candidatus Enterovibrio altilux]|uniref:Uncharacterized protein n=1 Tax=Candidatus Enterovibrio altilux TaxID=1927128 RepID=A0A291B7T9_9GAMM|nr:hypothetical protein BTN50_0551 [Candidatus Enterovibrio luxaltus]